MPLDPPLAEIPLWALDHSWLRVSCSCGRAASIPMRMAAARWPDLVLARVVGRLRCHACGSRPAAVFYADRADTFSAGGPQGGRRIWLVR